MNAAVAKVLNQFLGDWLEGLNSEQLNLSVFSGEVRLGPIRIKKEAVEKLGLPFQVRYGFVKRIYVRIPWAHLTSKPLIIEVEDVYVLSSLRPMSQWNSEVELTNHSLSKATRLDQLEVLNSEAFSPPAQAGFVEKLVAKIVANVQIKISNVYLRIEDQQASTEDFAMGVVLRKIEAVTCDEFYHPAFVEGSDAVYKSATISDLSFFLDYGEDHLLSCEVANQDLAQTFEDLAKQEVRMEFTGKHVYLLAPSGVDLKVKMNKDTKRKTLPEIEAGLVIGQHSPIQLGIETPQLTHLLKFAEFYSAYSSFQAGILSKVDKAVWTHTESSAYRQLYKEWSLVKDEKKKADPLRSQLTLMETDHAYEEIATNRTIAFEEIKEERAKETAFKDRSKSQEFFTGMKEFFGWKTGDAPLSPSIDSDQPMGRSQTEQVSKESMVMSPSVKSDALMYMLKVELPNLFFVVRSDTRPLITFVQEATTVDIALKEVTMEVSTQIGQILINDEVVNSLAYPYIFKAAKLNAIYGQRSNGQTDLRVRAEHAFIVANISCFLTLSKAFESAVSNEFDIDHYRKIAGEKVAGYVSAGQKYMEQIMLGEYSHQAMSLDIDFPAPCALIPLNIHDTKECLVVDFGRLIVKSQLVEGNFSEIDFKTMEDEAFLYDFYNVSILNMQIAALWEFSVIEKWTEGRISPLFLPSPLNIQIGNVVSKEIVRFPAFLVRVEFNKLAFHLSDDQLLFLLRLKDQLTEKIEAENPHKHNNGIKEENTDNTSEPVETRLFRDKIKQVEKVLSQHFQFTMGQLSISLSKKGQKLTELDIQNVKILATITDTSNVLVDFQMGELRVIDCRPGVFFTLVLGKPLKDSTASFLFDTDEEFEYHTRLITDHHVLNSDSQLSIRVKMTPKDDLMEGFVELSDMRLALSSDFVAEMMSYHVEAVSIAEAEARKRKLERIIAVKNLLGHVFSLKIRTIEQLKMERKFCSVRKKLLFTVFIQNLEAWVIESPKDAESRIIDVYLEATIRYNSYQTSIQHMDQKGNILSIDMMQIDDEATVDISKFGVISGFYRNNQIAKSAADKEELLTPFRMEIEYSLTKKGETLITHIESHLESVEITIGFRDMVHFKRLAAQWGALSQEADPKAPSKPGESAAKPVRKLESAIESRLKADFKCDNFELTIVDDTTMRILSLVFVDLHNVSTALEMTDHSITANFSTALKMNYYNLQIAIWEPIIEEWSLELVASQPDLRTPLGIELNSVCFLNINLSYLMAETVAIAMLKFNQDTNEWDKEEDEITVTETDLEDNTGSQIIYKLKNRLGVDIKAWLEGVDLHTREIWTILSGKTYRFGQALIDRARLKGMACGKRKYACLTQSAQQASVISIDIEHKGLVHNIILDDIGTKSFVIESSEGGIQETIVVDITSRGGERIVSVESSRKIMNNTDRDLEVLYKGSITSIKPMRVFSVPLDWLISGEQTSLMTGQGPVDVLNTIGIVLDTATTFLVLDYAVIDSGVTDEQGQVKIPHQKLIIVSPPTTIHNLTPSLMSLFVKGQEEAVVRLYPGNVKPLYEFEPKKVREHKWVLELEGGRKIETDWVLPRKNLEHYHLKGDFPCDKLSVEFIPMTYVKSQQLDLKFKKFIDEKWHSAIVQIYLQFLIVNTTPFTLEFTGKRDYLKIPKLSIGTVKDKKSHMSVRIAGDDFGTPSDWSKSFNIKTVGVAGSLTLNNSNAATTNADAPNVVQLGVKLSNAGWPLMKTVIVRVQPRFVLANYLTFPVLLRQKNKEKVINLSAGGSIPYQLENAKVGQAIQVSADGENWSSPFVLEVLEDFQIRFRDKPEALPVVQTEKKRALFNAFVAAKAEPPTPEKVVKLDWWKPSVENDCQRYVRVIISSEDEATLFISLTTPLDPEFMIWNKTESELTLQQEGCEYEAQVDSMKKVTFVYDNQLAKAKKMTIKIGSESESYVVDKIKSFSRRLAGNRVKVVTEGVTRVVIVEPDEGAEEEKLLDKGQDSQLCDITPRDLTWITSENRFENMKIKLNFQGLVLSLIDDQPCERFIFSISNIKIRAVNTAEPTVRGRIVSTCLKLNIGNIQLDNMLAKGSQFPVMFAPYVAKQDSKEEPVPFLQLRIDKEAISKGEIGSGKVEDTVIEHFKHVGMLMQPLHLQVHQDTIVGLMGVAARLQEAFQAASNRGKADSIISIEFVKICSNLDSAIPKLCTNASQVSAKAYFEFVNLNSMKIIVSFRSAKQTTSLQIDPREAFGIVSIFGRIGAAFINITDSPLHFSNLILVHSFQTLETMKWTIIENYIRQGVLQFYKIIGSVDMIGNPIGLIDKLGTGVFEFFNEPRKGLLKGPKEFAEGIGKGVKSLVSGVISGGFGSVSRITGSLYTVVRGVGGDDDSYDRLNRNDNVLEGVFHGFKGGLVDLGEGVIGLFTKPFKGAKSGGVTGFLKGVGSGLLGAVTAPLSAVLRVGTSVTAGIANTATILRTGKIQQKGRFRFPRPIGARKVIEPYNEEIAQAQELLHTLKDVAGDKLVFYQRIDDLVIVLITTKFVLEIVDGDVSSKVPLSTIEICQVHRLRIGFLLLACGPSGQIAIKAGSFTGLAKLFSVLTLCSSSVNNKANGPLSITYRAPTRRCCR